MPKLRKQLSGKHYFYRGGYHQPHGTYLQRQDFTEQRETKVSCKAQQSLLFPNLGLKSRISLVVPGKQAFLLKTGAAENLFIATFNDQIEGGFLT